MFPFHSFVQNFHPLNNLNGSQNYKYPPEIKTHTAGSVLFRVRAITNIKKIVVVITVVWLLHKVVSKCLQKSIFI